MKNSNPLKTYKGFVDSFADAIGPTAAEYLVLRTTEIQGPLVSLIQRYSMSKEDIDILSQATVDQFFLGVELSKMVHDTSHESEITYMSDYMKKVQELPRGENVKRVLMLTEYVFLAVEQGFPMEVSHNGEEGVSSDEIAKLVEADLQFIMDDLKKHGYAS